MSSIGYIGGSEFVTGFKKRKDERRKRAQDQIKIENKDKRKDIIAEKKRVGTKYNEIVRFSTETGSRSSTSK